MHLRWPGPAGASPVGFTMADLRRARGVATAIASAARFGHSTGMCGRFNVIDSPGLQQLLRDLGIDLQLPQGVKNYITPGGHARLKAELDHLLRVEGLSVADLEHRPPRLRELVPHAPTDQGFRSPAHKPRARLIQVRVDEIPIDSEHALAEVGQQ